MAIRLVPRGRRNPAIEEPLKGLCVNVYSSYNRRCVNVYSCEESGRTAAEDSTCLVRRERTLPHSWCRMKVALQAIGTVWICLAQVAALAEPQHEPQPVALVFDTDMGNDVDDALALAMIHAFQSRGECRLLAVTVTKDHPLAAAFVDGINRFYGRGDIPVGLVRDGATPDAGKFLPVGEHQGRGRPALSQPVRQRRTGPRGRRSSARCVGQSARQVGRDLAGGFLNELARLLDSPSDSHSQLNGRDLVAQKVKQLYAMAGHFEPLDQQQAPFKEYNVMEDIPSAQKLVDEWPTPIDFSGFEIGREIEYPAESIEEDYGYVEHHPIAEAYRLYMPPPHNRPTWDLTPVLQAVRPTRGYFGFSMRGRVSVDDEGVTHFADQMTRDCIATLRSLRNRLPAPGKPSFAWPANPRERA